MTPKCILLQTVRSQMKYRIAQTHNGIPSESTLFAKKKQSSEKEIEFYLKIITCDPSLYTIEYPMFIVSYQMEKSICA